MTRTATGSLTQRRHEVLQYKKNIELLCAKLDEPSANTLRRLLFYQQRIVMEKVWALGDNIDALDEKGLASIVDVINAMP